MFRRNIAKVLNVRRKADIETLERVLSKNKTVKLELIKNNKRTTVFHVKVKFLIFTDSFYVTLRYNNYFIESEKEYA